MTDRREIKQRSPAVWAKVKAAYLAGEPAASVARRFDVGIGNLRYRANAEGWTRKAAIKDAERQGEAEAARLEGRAGNPVENADGEAEGGGRDEMVRNTLAMDATPPREKLADGLRLAAHRLAQGRPHEAEALVRAVRALTDLTGEKPPCLYELTFEPPPEMETLVRAVEYRAWELVHTVLSATPRPPRGHEHFYFYLRDQQALIAGRAETQTDLTWVQAQRPDLVGLWDAEGRVVSPKVPADHELQSVIAVLAGGLRQGRDGDLRGWAAEARQDRARILAGLKDQTAEAPVTEAPVTEAPVADMREVVMEERVGAEHGPQIRML